MGFVKAGSGASLLAGVGSGAAALFGVHRYNTAGKVDAILGQPSLVLPLWQNADASETVVSGLMVFAMGRRFANSGKVRQSCQFAFLNSADVERQFMPSGLVTFLSALAFANYGKTLL